MDVFDVTGIILAGGKSSRMGEEKGLAMLNGKPLVVYALDTLQPLCHKMVISANHHLEDYMKFGVDVVEDAVKNIGPMGGVYTCLQRSSTRYNLILSCDTPFITTSLFTYLLDSVENDQAVVPSHDGGFIEPLCGVYATNVIWTLQSFIEKKTYKLLDFITAVNYKKVEIHPGLPFFSDDLFVNINTRNDLNIHSTHGKDSEE